MTTEPADPAAAHAEAVEQVWQLVRAGAPTTVVNSPPGAGKSTLVRATARRATATYGQIPVITQTNDQADDLVRSLADELAGGQLSVGRLHAQGYPPPAGVPASTNITDLQDCAVVIAPAAKWAYVGDNEWDLAIIDEAYQVSSADLVRIADRFRRLLLVGDPGQLSPFTTADERALRATGFWPLDTAAGTILRNYPDTPNVQLPVSWRLPPSGARVVADAFYSRPFAAGSTQRERGLRFPLGRIRDELDQALRVAADHGWCLAELSDACLPRTDPDALGVVAALIHRLLTSRATTRDGSVERPLDASGIAVGVSHRDQRAVLRSTIDRVCAALGQQPGTIAVDTANRLQGRQFEVVIAWHPLSGRRDASAFHLEAGRLCVLASRHRQACIVVSRAGIREQLDAYPHTEPVWLGTAPPQVDGWEANHNFLDHLEPVTVQVARS